MTRLADHCLHSDPFLRRGGLALVDPFRIDPLRVRRHGDVPGRDDAIAFDQDGAGEQRIPRRIGQATVDDGEFSHRETPLNRSP